MAIEIAQPDGYAKYLDEQSTPTELAIRKYAAYRSVYKKMLAAERELSVALCDPKVNLKEYYQKTKDM